MDLVSSLNSLNFLDQIPINIQNFAAVIDNNHTEFIICNFHNNITYIITQFGKIGNLYSVDTEKVENGICNPEPVYNLRTLLGGDNIEIEAGVRYISEQLKLKKPLIFSLTLKNYRVETLKTIVKAIRGYKS